MMKFILWEEYEIPNDKTTNASTSRQSEFDESDTNDPNRERMRRNISCLVDHNQTSDSNKYD